MSTVRLFFFAAVGLGAASCFSPVAVEDWPDRENPLFPYAVWVEVPGGLCSGVIVHSSPERGTWILTAAHCVQRELGLASSVDGISVGVFAPSHIEPIEGDWAIYEARVEALTGVAPPESAENEIDRDLARLSGMVELMGGADLALLRLETDRLFRAAEIHDAEPIALDGRESWVVAVVPEMHPHAKRARCRPSSIACDTGVKGNSGSGVFVDGKLVGVWNLDLDLSSGPEDLREFLGGTEKARFLLPLPGARAPAGE